MPRRHRLFNAVAIHTPITNIFPVVSVVSREFRSPLRTAKCVYEKNKRGCRLGTGSVGESHTDHVCDLQKTQITYVIAET